MSMRLFMRVASHCQNMNIVLETPCHTLGYSGVGYLYSQGYIIEREREREGESEREIYCIN